MSQHVETRTVPKRALAFGAHPDDIEFGAGATLAQWSTQGCDVVMAVFTDGSKGAWDPGADRAELIETRIQEQRRAASELGASDTVMMGYIDGDLWYTPAVVEEVCRLIRTYRPDVVLGHDPWKRYRLHPDHRHAGFATVDGVVAARDHLFFPDQGLPAHRPSALWLFEADQPNHWEPIDLGFTAKMAALAAHHSQWESTMGATDEASWQRFVDEQKAKYSADPPRSKREPSDESGRSDATSPGEDRAKWESFHVISDV
ncbi:MAG: PIG-L family deacetylase [Acidimicrobiia bacterium]|nr:PIG-L family deacetylase [Acidimicrobiia bacterium]MBP8181232.1 PIG-L family deacetylase [Acidimicrobiia bacterium]